MKPENLNILILVLIILVSSLIGGIVSWVFRNDPLTEEKLPENGSKAVSTQTAKKYPLWNSLLVGFAGAIIVPLFLSLGGNGLLKQSETDPINYFAFAGFCVLGAIFARDFLNSMGKTLLKRVDNLDKKIDEKVNEALKLRNEAQKDSSKKIIDSTQVLRKEIDKVKKAAGLWDSGLKTGPNTHAEMSFASESAEKGNLEIMEKRIADHIETRKKLKRPPTNDLQKYQWADKAESNGRKLSAKVRKLQKYWYKINITVTSTDDNKPLKGIVILYVHDSFQFKNDRIILDVDDDGVAREELRAYGAFTVGAVCDEGMTFLELDLAELPDIDREFREN